MKQSSIETKPAAAPRRRRRVAKNQAHPANFEPSLLISGSPEKDTEKEVQIDYQVSIAYTQPRRHRPALLPEERLLCELRHKIYLAKNIAPFAGAEVVGYDLNSEDKPYFSGGGFFIQQYKENDLIAWRMGVYETFCLGMHPMPALLVLLENICENAKTRIR